MRQQVANALVGETRQFFQMFANTSAQTGDLLRQDDAEFGYQPAQAVVGGRTFFDKTLPRAVQGENDLLVLFLDRDKTHVGSGDGFANGCRIRCVVLSALAAHAVRGNELGGHQFDGVAVIPEQSCPVMRARAGFDTN